MCGAILLTPIRLHSVVLGKDVAVLTLSISIHRNGTLLAVLNSVWRFKFWRQSTFSFYQRSFFSLFLRVWMITWVSGFIVLLLAAQCIHFPCLEFIFCSCLFVDGWLESELLLQVVIRIMMPTVMHTVLPMTHPRSRPFRTVHRTTGAPALIWGREDRILTLPFCIQALGGTLLAMRSLPTVTRNRCSRHPC
jgi:hypothetical protein